MVWKIQSFSQKSTTTYSVHEGDGSQSWDLKGRISIRFNLIMICFISEDLKRGQIWTTCPASPVSIYILLDSSSFFHLYKWHTRDYNATTDSFPCHDRRWTLIAQRPWIFWSWRSPGTYDKWVEVGIFCGNLGETRNLFASICYKDEDTGNFLGFHELH